MSTYDGPVAFRSPEDLAAAARAEFLRTTKETDPNKLIDEIESLTARYQAGEYVAVTGEETKDGVTSATFGRKLVWVDDAPDDPEDGKGHFETYSKTAHGETYRPRIAREDDS